MHIECECAVLNFIRWIEYFRHCWCYLYYNVDVKFIQYLFSAKYCLISYQFRELTGFGLTESFNPLRVFVPERFFIQSFIRQEH